MVVVGLRHISAAARVVDMAFAYAVDVAVEHLVMLMAGDPFLGTSLEFHILCVFFSAVSLEIRKQTQQSKLTRLNTLINLWFLFFLLF